MVMVCPMAAESLQDFAAVLVSAEASVGAEAVVAAEPDLAIGGKFMRPVNYRSAAGPDGRRVCPS